MTAVGLETRFVRSAQTNTKTDVGHVLKNSLSFPRVPDVLIYLFIEITTIINPRLLCSSVLFLLSSLSHPFVRFLFRVCLGVCNATLNI